MDSLVLDIQRSSFHDGPGVRTTVFLKGCPLHCPWCHNPESQSFTRELSCNLSRCTHCGACAAACGEGVHRFRDGAHAVDFSRCQHCGGCVGACPSGALTLFGFSMSAEEVFSIVRRDKVFYDSTGGGVTLSGGEPLSHPDFCADLLTLCKQAGISTCLETSGFAGGKTLSRLLPLVDCFLFDCKVLNEADAKKYLGVPLSPILQNLETVCLNGKEVILRCPVIPSVNDSMEHFDGILKLLSRYPAIKRAELLPYHRFGVVKSTNLGKAPAEYPVPDDETKGRWLNYFKEHGVCNVTLG